MKRTILLTLFLAGAFFISDACAQEYKSAIGARLGYPLSISYKTFLSESGALELTGGTRGVGSGIGGYRWYTVSGAYQIHKLLDLGEVDNLYYYYGFGASVYFWNFNDGFLNAGSSTSFGLQGYLGLSYSFEDTPINITVDWVPTYFLNGFGSGFGADYGSLGIRYIIGR